MSRRRFAASVTLGSALAAGVICCSLTTSLDGYSGGSLPPEAEPPDGTTFEAGGGADADAPVDVDAADGGRFCATLGASATFCDDFDDEGAFSRWTRLDTRAGGTVTRDRLAALSAPNAMLAVSPASAQSGAAALELATPTTVRRVHVTYDMRIEGRDPQSGYSEVGYIRLGSAASFYFRVYGGPSQAASFAAEAYLPDGGVPAHDLTLAGGPTLVDWTHVDVDVDLRSAPQVTVSIDGAVAATTALEPLLYPARVATVSMGIGYTGTPTAVAWKLRYDNVMVSWEP